MSANSAPERGFLPASGYIRQNQLIPSIVPVSSATLWRMVKTGEFPKPIKLTKRCTAWKVEDIRAWMEARNSEVEAQP